MNFALEELRQVDFARYNKKSKAPLLLFPCSLLFQLRGSRPHFIFYTQFDKHQDFAFALSEALGILPRLFSSI